MLPAGPRAGGLPSGPRSGRAVGPGGQSRREGPSHYDHESRNTARRPRSQHSNVGSHKRSHSRPPRHQTTSSASSSSSSGSSNSKDSSALSSSGSSLFERMKTGATSYTSSFTSLEDNQKKQEDEDERSRWQQVDEKDTQSGDGYGQAIWTRVASAASTLTVSVSKAWATNIAIYAGEETPPGQESRLTRAMKAYHIEKARDPTELPSWLFDEHERRPRRTAPKDPMPEEHVETERTIPRSTTPRGLRDVYDAAVSNTLPIHQPNSGDTSSATQRTERKGTDRLRALREAKRTQVIQDTPREAVPSRPPPRVGLPSGGPRGNKRV
ncbi:hypothetical protein Moror_6515 [Moniliophthora roreri MCA 2997]|uniref:Mso1 N-terminal domain-containing protein n=2 Tax=Moniliophthora roreri TaxID=221103 RepID=V2XT46_MONRO|nr:hypothetical protein Moror_6515 [Moniliophthora roreri MCA 2997]KAI3610421.1 hypothetical protein WG66_007042 [Moniliophthora roreri]